MNVLKNRERLRLGLVHGMLDRPAVWDRLIPLLEDSFDVVAPEFPWGPAPKGSGDLPPHVVPHAFGDRYPEVIVAHSRGAYECVREIVTTGDPGALLVMIGWTNQTPAESHSVIPADGPELLEMSRGFITDRARVDGTLLSDVKRDWLATYAMRRFAEWDRNVHVDPAALVAVTSPVLHLLGENDETVRNDETGRLLAALSDGESAVIRDASHWPMLEQPAAVAEAIIDFVGRRLR